MAELDQIDRRIFDLLARNGRMSNLEVARHLGVSEKTIRQRIRRMTERDGLRVIATLDRPPAPSQLMVMIHADPGQRFAVAARLAALPEVDEIHLTTGAFELIVHASFASDAEALEFYVRQVESGPGVQDAMSVHIIETINPKAGSDRDLFEEFDLRAAQLSNANDLFDLACEMATSHLGTERIVVSGAQMGQRNPDTPLWQLNIRWRGLSSRYIETICTTRLSESVVRPTVIERGQHLFVPDAQSDPLFERIADLVASERFHSFLAVPVRCDDTNHGTMNLYYDTVIPFQPDLVARAQQLADLLGKHIARSLKEPVTA